MDETEIDIRSIFGLLRRQFRLIFVTTIMVVGLATLVAFSLTPTFTSSALVLVDPSKKNLLDPDAQMSSVSGDSARIDSEVELVRSDNVLLQVIQNENLTSDDEFGVSFGTTARLLQMLRIAEPTLPTGEEALNQTLTKLRNAVSVQRRGLTYLISVQVRSESAQRSAQLANAITAVYISDQLASKVNSMLASRDVLQARVAQARQAIVQSEGSFDTFIDENIGRITEDTGRTDLAQMQAEVAALAAARTSNMALSQQVRADFDSGDIAAVVANLQSDALAELQRQRDAVNARLGAQQGTAAEVDLRAELAAIETQLRARADQEIGDLEQSLISSQEQENTLRQTIRREVLDSTLSADVLARLYELQQNSEIARTQYQTLLSRVQDVETQADLQLADSRIVSPALAPQSPSFPNRMLIIFLSVVAGIGLGVGVAFLYENLIGGFTSEEQIAAALRTPVGGTVPRERAKSEKESVANLMVTAPLSVYSESVRRIRTSIQAALRSLSQAGERGRPRNVVMVTSTAPNEGKTTLALSIARSYAMFGQRALLVDCDLRKPSLHRHLQIQPTEGFVEFLSQDNGTLDIVPILQQDNLTQVTIIVGSHRSDVPTDQLLASPTFERLITAASKSFDVVILDTPPVGPVVDGLFIAQFVDAIVFVTRWAATSQRDARRSVQQLNEAKAPDVPVITVLNQQDEAQSSYARRYGAYYSYNS